jgi:Predicted drug exporters of the RND superfamily
MNGKSFLFERWPRFAHRHALGVLGAAGVVFVSLAIALSMAGSAAGDSFTIPGSEAQTLFTLLQQRFPSTAGDTATVVVKAPAGMNDSGVHSQIDSLRQTLTQLPHVGSVSSPYEDAEGISADGTIARLSVQYDVRASDISRSSAQALIDAVHSQTKAGFEVEAGGSIPQKAERTPPGSTELIGIAAAIIILLLAFGSLVAMGLPILTALIGLGSGFFLVGLLQSFASMPSFTAEFGAMIGIGVGIDYALFIVTRYREAREGGLPNEDATVIAAATAGRSVFFAGGTVVIALLGLWASGITSIGWVGTAGAIIVGCSVSVAVFVLPALLRYIGPYIDRWRIPGLHAAATETETGIGYRLSRFVQRNPLICLGVSLAILLTLAIPVISLRLGNSDAGNDPPSYTTRKAYDLVSEGFGPGTNGPILVGVSIDNPRAVATAQQLPQFVSGLSDIASVSPVRFNDTQTAAVMTLLPKSAPQDQATVDLINQLRSNLRKDFAGSGAQPLVGGSTALFIDVSNHMSSRLPIFFAAVIALSFLLLMSVFRSIAVPIKAALMNLLSIGASFGILVAIFQWGWFGSILGVSRTGPVEAFLPMMLFAVLFGLSMDYEVFLVSRIREEYLISGDNSDAVARGLSMTTRVITAAASIMVAVFGSFALGNERVIKEFGIGLASAIFIDATIVRLILVPSLMQLMGKWNWWMPHWLDRVIPRLYFEGPAPEPAVPAIAGGSD